MALPRWLTYLTKHVFNPREIRKGTRPVLVHRGRTSGREYMTPLDAHPVDEGYILVANYGVGSDWVQNVLAAGTAEIRVDGRTHVVDRPMVIDRSAANTKLRADANPPPAWLGIDDFVLLHLTTEA